MSISRSVYETLNQEYQSGMTQEEVAAKHHVRQGQIQKLLSNARSADGLLLKTLDKMFPNASINLYGDNNIMQTASNVSVRNGSVNTISMNSGAAAEQIRARIIAALIPLDIQPDALQTVLRAINELNLE